MHDSFINESYPLNSIVVIFRQMISLMLLRHSTLCM